MNLKDIYVQYNKAQELFERLANIAQMHPGPTVPAELASAELAAADCARLLWNLSEKLYSEEHTEQKEQ